MWWFFLTALAVIIIVISAFVVTIPEARLGAAAVIAITAGLWLVLTGVAMFHSVENGHIGIVKQFGAIVDTTGDGAVAIAPWRSLSEVSVQNELRTFPMGRDNSAVSQDSQPVFLVVQVNYSLLRDQAVPLYKETGGHFIERILDPAVYQNTKQVTAKYKAIDFAKNRETIRLQIEAAVEHEVGPHGLQINNVSLKNVDFTDTFSAAIEQTVQAEQNAKREEAKVRISEAQARQAVAEANGEATAEIERAKGDATATVTRARADASANRLRNRTLSPRVIQWEAIQKINPRVAVIICPPRTVCVPNNFVPASP